MNKFQNNSRFDNLSPLNSVISITNNDKNEKNVIFGGRLGQYKYYDMDKCIETALTLCDKELK